MNHNRKKILPFVGRNFSECGLSILIVGSQQFTTSLETALSHCFLQDCTVDWRAHSCQSVHALLRLPVLCTLHFDFIVFAVDTRMSDALSNLRRDLNHIDKHFLVMSRVCLVASNMISYGDVSILSYRLHDAAIKLHCPLLLGNILDDAKCRTLAQRLAHLVATVTGVKTGVPLLLARTEENSERLGHVSSAKHVFE